MTWDTMKDEAGISSGTIKIIHNEAELKISISRKCQTTPGWVAIVTGSHLSVLSPLRLIRLETATDFESAIFEAKKQIANRLCSLIDKVIDLPSS